MVPDHSLKTVGLGRGCLANDKHSMLPIHSSFDARLARGFQKFQPFLGAFIISLLVVLEGPRWIYRIAHTGEGSGVATLVILVESRKPFPRLLRDSRLPVIVLGGPCWKKQKFAPCALPKDGPSSIPQQKDVCGLLLIPGRPRGPSLLWFLNQGPVLNHTGQMHLLRRPQGVLRPLVMVS